MSCPSILRLRPGGLRVKIVFMHGVVRLSLGILHGAPESLRHAHLQLHFETAAGLVQDTIVSNAVLVFESLVQNQLLTSSSTSTMTFATSLSSQQALLTPSIPSITSPESTSVARAPLSDDIRHPHARACVLWLIGQYGSVPGTGTIVEGVADWAPDVLRKAARSFNTEASLVKIQTLTLVLLAPTHRALPLLAQNVLTLARCDGDWDVRDRTRMLRALLIGAVADVMGNNDDEGIGGNWDKEEQSGRPGVVLRRERVTRMLFEGRTGMIGVELVTNARPLGTLSLVMESESLHLHDGNNDKTVVDLPRVAGTGNRPFKREGLLEAVGLAVPSRCGVWEKEPRERPKIHLKAWQLHLDGIDSPEDRARGRFVKGRCLHRIEHVNHKPGIGGNIKLHTFESDTSAFAMKQNDEDRGWTERWVDEWEWEWKRG
ncbi:hypothetical protein EDD22DRAFT_1053517 [Suillus occidentalis]|nr:hypothetical protein EDD22DRAFT_1053517 [Suillus occidentalis]